MNSNKRWIGRWLIGVAILHTVVGVIMGQGALATLWRRGVINSVGADAMTGVFVWFFFCGAVLALLGMALDKLEKSGGFDGARALGIGLALLSLAGVVLMPVSGFWLMFPPAIALMRRAN